jgi:hypothetical protein
MDDMGRPTTNIGTTDMTRVRGGKPPAATPPTDLPTARRIQSEPLWTSRWQQSATVPLSRAPWVTGYRFWRSRIPYEDDAGRRIGPMSPGTDWIDLSFKSGKRFRYKVPETVCSAFVQLTQQNRSVGQWVHENLLAGGRNAFPTEAI